MSADPALVLRDIHAPGAPSWWPPAPGWWLLVGLLLVMAVVVAWWRHRNERRRRAWAGVFDRALVEAGTAPARVAAMSELLRRAARTRDAQADRLEGEAWLALLDGGDERRPFRDGVGRLLLDGGFRPSLDEGEVAALQALARGRFLAWMPRR